MIAPEFLVFLLFALFLGSVFIGIPIAYSLMGSAVLMAVVTQLLELLNLSAVGFDFYTMGLMVNRLYKLMNNWVLVALPLFIFMGIVLEKTDLANSLMKNLAALLSRLRGGLALAVLLIGVLLAASTGIIGASVVLLGTLALPAMLKENYSKELACGVVCSAGCLGILIPPSIMLVIMADQLTIPVGDLFLGAVIRGCCCLHCIFCIF